MIIKKKRINKIDNILSLIGNQDFYISTACNESTLKKLGFQKYDIGESIVPNIIGPSSRLNREGQEIIDKSEKEKIVHSIPYNINDWHGNPHSGYYDREFTRWKIIYIEPLHEKMFIKSYDGHKYLLSTQLLSPDYSKERIKNAINLFLEVNGEIEILDSKNEGIIGTKKVSWKILPPGDMPWEEYYGKIKDKMHNYDREQIKCVKERYEFLKSLNPQKIICGVDGFSGYFIAAFNDDLFICDSIFLGNAIYILNNNWEKVSKLTKKEIIDNGLAKDRIVHKGDWQEKVIELLNR